MRKGIVLSDLMLQRELQIVNSNSNVRHLPTKFYSEVTVYDLNLITATGAFGSFSETNVYQILHDRYIGLNQNTWKPD
jgi:hypothetical protein